MELLDGGFAPGGTVGAELDDGFDHRHGGGIGGGFGATDFAVDGENFGEGGDELVGLLEDFLGLGDGEGRIGGGHVEEVAFVERGHELGADAGEGVVGGGEAGECEEDDQGRKAHGELEEGGVKPLEEVGDGALVLVDDFLGDQEHSDQNGPADGDPPLVGIEMGEGGADQEERPGGDEHGGEGEQGVADGAPLFGEDAAGDEVVHQHRDDGDGEEGRRGHGEGFGECERFKESARLTFEHEDRKEADGDDEEGEEELGADFDGGVADEFVAGGGGKA